jgi:response regulator NasT
LIVQIERVDNFAMPLQDLAILMIDENRIRASIIEDGLREAGHLRVTVVHDDQRGGPHNRARGMPDVVVIDLENPKRDTLEHFFSA